MNFFELILIAFGLSMDAGAASICKGLCVRKLTPRHCLTTGLWFGVFQGLMPMIGYFLGNSFKEHIAAFDHWIAFFLLGFIGINMIKESQEKDESEIACDLETMHEAFNAKKMLPIAIATSIDALAIGVTFALLPNVNIGLAALLIASVTFIMSFFGVYVGHTFGQRYRKHAEIAGGLILIALGTKILIEHLTTKA